ncbi:uncharacterized protein LOC122455601 [Dermochelys coriacea]|uniref:uncharacterized protein LOC122455601 n=1 Tax=Dermochelys coriacea TaxID=27794 RepID=UPI001CA88B44|nr:uncharacterized protein LOC122455601 [Dermochelys coriacea]
MPSNLKLSRKPGMSRPCRCSELRRCRPHTPEASRLWDHHSCHRPDTSLGRGNIPDPAHHPATVQGSVHVDCPRRCPDCPDGCRPTRTLGTTRLCEENINRSMADVTNGPRLAGDTAVGRGTIVYAIPARTPVPSLRQGTVVLGVNHWHLADMGPPVEAVHGAATTISATPLRRDHGPMADIGPGTADTPGPEAAADHTPAWPPLAAARLQAKLASPNSRPHRASASAMAPSIWPASGHLCLQRSPQWRFTWWPGPWKHCRRPSLDRQKKGRWDLCPWYRARSPTRWWILQCRMTPKVQHQLHHIQNS